MKLWVNELVLGDEKRGFDLGKYSQKETCVRWQKFPVPGISDIQIFSQVSQASIFSYPQYPDCLAFIFILRYGSESFLMKSGHQIVCLKDMSFERMIFQERIGVSSCFFFLPILDLVCNFFLTLHPILGAVKQII